MIPTDTIRRFDEYLAERGLRLDAVVIGGAAFAALMSEEGETLDEDWLNNGPSSLVRLLPDGWLDHVQLAFSGVSITLHTLGRLDLLRTKLFGLCDRGLDIGDCIALSPTAAELNEVLPWLQEQDANPNWPAHVEVTLVDLAKRLGHEL